jgi:ribosome maturation factor RimP
MTPFEAKLIALIDPSLTGLGYELVRVQMRGTERKTLQIMAERLDRRSMTLNDCETISKTLSAVLDVADPISDRYSLEVSSPGIDRPLMKLVDFDRFKGFDAKVDLRETIGNRRHFSGRLAGTKGDNTILMTLEKDEAVELPFDQLQRAKLILTDALINAHLKEQEQHETANQNTN